MGLITLDLETYYSKEYSLSKMTTEEYIRDTQFNLLIAGLRLPDGTFVTEDLSGYTTHQTTEFFLDHEVHKHALLCQNTAFDASILNWLYDVRPKAMMDTMLLARVALRDVTGGTSLKNIAVTLGIGQKGEEVVDALGKHRADFDDEQWAEYMSYCENDVALTYTAMNIMIAQIPPRELKVIDTTLRWYTQPVLELDTVALDNAVYAEKRKMQKLLDSTGLDAKILSSNKQFKEWLESQGVPCPMKPSPTLGKPDIPALAKTDAGFRQLALHENPTIADACVAREQSKSRIKETRMERLAGIGKRNNNKLPVPLLYSGAHTHRYAGAEKINLQNLTHGDAMRGSITAPKGHKIISADQGQIEARINALLSHQDDLVEDFRRGNDVYVGMAAQLYDGDITSDRRKVGKAAVLGCGYQMGSDRFFDFQRSMKLGLSKEFSVQVVDAYRMKYWHIVENWKTGKQMLNVMVHGGEAQWGPCVVSANKITLPSGMVLHYRNIMFDGDQYKYERWSKLSRRWEWVKIFGGMLVENVCQALARELLVDQMLILEKKWPSCHQIHDEIWFVVKDEEVSLACQVMKKVMEIPPAWMPDLPLKVEPSAGNNGGELK